MEIFLHHIRFDRSQFCWESASYISYTVVHLQYKIPSLQTSNYKVNLHIQYATMSATFLTLMSRRTSLIHRLLILYIVMYTGLCKRLFSKMYLKEPDSHIPRRKQTDPME